MPPDFYADYEQVAAEWNGDVLALRELPSLFDDLFGSSNGATATIPPTLSRSVAESPHPTPRRVAVRSATGDQVVALIEIISTANKDRTNTLETVVDKVEGALREGIHVLVIDVLRPTARDPLGIHAAIWQRIGPRDLDDKPADEPLTLASYTATRPVSAYVANLGIGTTLPDMPLFLTHERFVNVPLEATYLAA